MTRIKTRSAVSISLTQEQFAIADNAVANRLVPSRSALIARLLSCYDLDPEFSQSVNSHFAKHLEPADSFCVGDTAIDLESGSQGTVTRVLRSGREVEMKIDGQSRSFSLRKSPLGKIWTYKGEPLGISQAIAKLR